jgi:hypothetical protein
MTILNPDRSRIVSVEFIDNPYHGNHYTDEGELWSIDAERLHLTRSEYDQ